jgi:thiol-disulfide isomerase/thioredoxin
VRLALAGAALALALTGCSGGGDAAAPGESRVEVDTPALQALKSRTDVEDCQAGTAGAARGPLPDVTLPCLGGGPDVDLAGLRGPLIVNLWASWCGPCRQEMPALAGFYRRYGDRVGVLGVDYQDQFPQAALELAQKSGVGYPLVADPGGEVNAADPIPVVNGLPYLLFVTADGDVSVTKGGVDSVDDVVALADQHLGTDL